MFRHTIPGSNHQRRLPERYLAPLLLSFGLLAAGVLLQNDRTWAARRSRPAWAENGGQEKTSAGKVDSSPQTPGCVVPPLGLVSWWPGDGTTTDIQGSSNGTLANGATFAAGRVAQAFSLDGVNGSVNVPATPALDIRNQLTIDFWMKGDPGNSMNTCCQGLVTTANYLVEISGGVSANVGINFAVIDAAGNPHHSSDAAGSAFPIPPGEWHHIAGVYNKTNLLLYVDGVERRSSPFTGSISPMPQSANSFLAIGSEDGRPNCPPGFCVGVRYFKGLIDEVEVFDRALTASEIQSLFNAGSAGKCKSSSLIQFNAADFSVNEGCTAATVTVTRAGDTSSQSTVDVISSDRSAQQRTDYEVTSRTLVFDAGQTSETFPVIVNKDAYAEGNETLNLSFNNPTAAILAAQNNASVTIADDPSVMINSQPLDDDANFVCQHYHDFLSREPDSGGAAFWTGEIAHCGADPVCIRNKRVDVSNAFFYELEFQQTGAYVFRLYRAAYGNAQPFANPDSSNATEAHKLPAYLVFARDRARVEGGANLAQGQQHLADLFVQRPDFLAKYPANLDGSSFIDAVLNRIKDDLAVDLTAQKPGLLTLFSSGGRGAVLYRLADDNMQTNPINNRPFIDAEYNRAFVTTQYFGYLRRDSDINGFLFWLGQVNAAPLRDLVRQHAMVCSFITSAEYQQRFSAVVTRTNGDCPR